MTMIKGIAASNGIAIAKAYKLVMPDLTVTRFIINYIFLIIICQYVTVNN